MLVRLDLSPSKWRSLVHEPSNLDSTSDLELFTLSPTALRLPFPTSDCMGILMDERFTQRLHGVHASISVHSGGPLARIVHALSKFVMLTTWGSGPGSLLARTFAAIVAGSGSYD